MVSTQGCSALMLSLKSVQAGDVSQAGVVKSGSVRAQVQGQRRWCRSHTHGELRRAVPMTCPLNVATIWAGCPARTHAHTRTHPCSQARTQSSRAGSQGAPFRSDAAATAWRPTSSPPRRTWGHAHGPHQHPAGARAVRVGTRDGVHAHQRIQRRARLRSRARQHALRAWLCERFAAPSTHAPCATTLADAARSRFAVTGWDGGPALRPQHFLAWW